jgi:hypothetical protein
MDPFNLHLFWLPVPGVRSERQRVPELLHRRIGMDLEKVQLHHASHRRVTRCLNQKSISYGALQRE